MKFKITYWICGTRKVIIVKASSKSEAMYKFYMENMGADIERVEKVDE